VSPTTQELEPVTVSSAHLAVTVQRRGADVTSIALMPSGEELLWQSGVQSEHIRGSDDETGFFETYPGGIQDIFPNADAATQVLGARLPFHGEAHRQTWDVNIIPVGGRREIVAKTTLRRIPFELRKRVSLDENDSLARIELIVRNTTPKALPFHWGFHPTFSEAVTAPPAFVITDSDGFRSGPEPFSESQSYPPNGVVPSEASVHGNTTTLCAPSTMTADLVYADPLAGWCVITSETSNIAVGLTWPIDVLPALWLWQECSGTTGYPWWGREHIVGVEPHSSWPTRPLDTEVADGAASWMQAGETIAAMFTLRAEYCTPAQLENFVSRTTHDASSVASSRSMETT
jgi:hypothetical protein